MPRKENVKIVKVSWLDAALETHSSVLSDAKNYKPILREQFGGLIHQSKERIVVVFGTIEGFKDDEATFEHAMIIPRGMIKKLTVLGESDLA